MISMAWETHNCADCVWLGVAKNALIIGVRDQFHLGGGGGLRSVANIFIHCLPENQVVLPEYYTIFCLKMAI